MTVRNYSYAELSPRQTLDLYLPAERGDDPLPLVVLLHPGGFEFGDASMEQPIALALVREGFAAASVNYRLSGETQYPAGACDAKAAVRWLRANADELGLDSGAFAAWGRSAGGWLAVMLGVTGDQETIFDDPALGNAEQSAAVQAVVSWYGFADFARLDADAALLPEDVPTAHHGGQESVVSRWLGSALATSPLASSADLGSYLPRATRLPSFFLAHGDRDGVVAPEQSRRLAAEIEAVGGVVALTIFVGSDHADPVLERAQLAPSIQFVRRHLCR